MAAELVGGGAFLSSFLHVVWDRLSSPEFVNLIRGKKLDLKLVQRLESALYVVQGVVSDAEQKQIKDPAVKKWLDNLIDVVYVLDDLLDQVSTKAATQKDVSNFLSRYLNLPYMEIVDEMEGIVDALESFVKQKDIVGLKEIAWESMLRRVPSTSLVVGSNIFGRDENKEAIIKLLLDDNSDGKISVIPIVGMGGIGKTTLAQLVYNDDKVKQEFDLRVWVCVSEYFDILRDTKIIIEAVTSSPCNMKDLNLLQLDLKEKLAGKKFLIVLDDMWNEDYILWKNFQNPFQYGVKGSKILVTTRSEKVASIVQTILPYNLNQLSDEDCWLVFASHAFISHESRVNSTLENIGREIVKKCKGLPLASKALGGLLRTEHDVGHWIAILNSAIWELPENDSMILPALRISYLYLPSHLKRCFVYCSLYPKDYTFDRDELILLWMAEDLLNPPKRGMTLEEVGYEYFDDLLSRSFFQHFATVGNFFVMHDLIHDLATFAAGVFYFRSEELGTAAMISNRTRHLSHSMSSYSISKVLEAFCGVKYLRTFLPINLKRWDPFNVENAPCIILSKFKYLRVLSFNFFCDLDALPHSIGELIHLRYLDLSDTSINTLPESLSNLYNLQTLKLYKCYKLTMLPSGMQNLVNLRHLDIRRNSLKEMPKGMSKLKHLQLLSDFIVGKHEENGIRELGGLANLHGSFSITKLENVGNSSEALEARMMDKKHINCLYLRWSSGVKSADSQTEREILEKLQPHRDLKELFIECYRGTIFPDWLGHSSYHNMTYLAMKSCGNCRMLPSLGQLPSLKQLKIENFSGLETIGPEFYRNDDDSYWETPFPSLEYLKFRGLSSWQLWHSFESDAFPQLKHLTISQCPRLTGHLPNHLPALETLALDYDTSLLLLSQGPSQLTNYGHMTTIR